MAKDLVVKIVGDSSSFNKSIDSATKKTSGFGSSLGGLAKAGAIGAAVGGVALLGKGLLSSVNAAKDAEQAQSRLEDALKSANVSYAKHGDAIDSAIQKTSRLAAVDDEDLSDAFSKLVRSSGDVNKSLEGMNLAADIAAARHISLEASTKLVEKAMNGNVNAFKKVGLEVKKGTTATEALEAAQKKFAGAAEAHGNTAAGAQEKLGIAFENLQEKVGQKLLPVLARLATKMTELVTWAEANWPRFAKSIQPVIESLDDIWKAIQVVWKVAQPILEVALPAAFKLVGFQIKVLAGIFEIEFKVISAVISGILKVVDKFLGGIQAIAEGASHLPFVGDKFKGVAEQIGHAREKVRELAASIDNLHSKEITVTVNTINHEQSISGGARGGRAAGGPVTAGQGYIVGEKGPEFFMPNQSGTIIPNGGGGGGAAWADGGGDNVNHIHVYLDGKELFSSVQRVSTRKAARGDNRAAFA